MAEKRKPQLAALRVKVKSLAEEQRVIKAEERRAMGRRVGAEYRDGVDGRGVKTRRRLSPGVFVGRDDETRLSLFDHRMGLRRELRATLLAYAFLRGRDYRRVEPKTGRYGGPGGKDNPPPLDRVQQIVAKFGVVAKPNSTAAKDWMAAELKAWVADSLAVHPFAAETKRDPQLAGA